MVAAAAISRQHWGGGGKNAPPITNSTRSSRNDVTLIVFVLLLLTAHYEAVCVVCTNLHGMHNPMEHLDPGAACLGNPTWPDPSGVYLPDCSDDIHT